MNADLKEADTRPYVYEFSVGRDAADVIAACQRRVEELGSYFGEGSKEHLTALVSWSRQLTRLIGLPMAERTSVMKDMAGLSLYVNGGIRFGIIFHPVRRHCTNEDCHAIINDNGTSWVYMAEWRQCDNHVPSYPLDAPTPGSWSFHS